MIKTMTNEEILKKAIEKAAGNGYIWYLSNSSEGYKLWTLENETSDTLYREYYKYIFSHDFAKSFWGEELNWGKLCNEIEDYEPDYEPEWKYRIQQMVLEPEPLKYLEKFLDE